jgi:hypothetical protein
VDLVAVLLELIHLVGRKECGHFVCLGLDYPSPKIPESIFDGELDTWIAIVNCDIFLE